MKIMCIGDSLTYGYPHEEVSSWPYIIGQRNGWEMINFGENGQSSGDVLCRVSEEGYFFKNGKSFGTPDPVDKAIILCGSNDFVFGTCHILNTLANILQMALLSKNAGIEPVIAIPILCNPEQATESWVEGTDYDKVNEQLMDLRDKLIDACNDFGFKYIDVQEKYKEFGKLEDGLHPTVEGYKFIADIIEEEIKDE